jgi:hypothetical protein
VQKSHPSIIGVTFLAGMMVGALFLSQSLFSIPLPSVARGQETVQPKPDLASLQAEIERLKQIVPDQAHAMHDVDYHFTNLWFAANQSNWPLAQFYFNETRSHLRWAVRIIPIRKDNAGKEVKLQDILQAMENSPLKQLEESITAKDREKFVAAYEFTLTTCYSCHKAADKPYLRPRIPDHPASAMMNFDPNAAWPK